MIMTTGIQQNETLSSFFFSKICGSDHIRIKSAVTNFPLKTLVIFDMM